MVPPMVPKLSRIIAIVAILEATSKKVFWPNFMPSLQILDILARATEKRLIT